MDGLSYTLDIDGYAEGRAVFDALEQIDISARHKRVFCARFHGATYLELGEELGVSVERARQLYCKAERAVKRRLVREGIYRPKDWRGY